MTFDDWYDKVKGPVFQDVLGSCKPEHLKVEDLRIHMLNAWKAGAQAANEAGNTPKKPKEGMLERIAAKVLVLEIKHEHEQRQRDTVLRSAFEIVTTAINAWAAACVQMQTDLTELTGVVEERNQRIAAQHLVATAITRKWLTVDAIREATGLSKAQVRAALVSKSLKDVVERRDGKDGKEYRVG